MMIFPQFFLAKLMDRKNFLVRSEKSMLLARFDCGFGHFIARMPTFGHETK